MIASPNPCDPMRLKRLVEDHLSELEQDDLAGHLETCDRCRNDLDRLAASSRLWNEARLLRFEDGREAAEVSRPTGPIGPYEILDVIGRGGMGIVLKAQDLALDRLVAIKMLAPVLTTTASARRRFAREAKAAAAVVHDHIVSIHAVDEHDGQPYLVMSYIPGRSLQERIDRDGPLEVKEVLRIGNQAASALAAAHAQGVVHRDVKPANILLENCVERVKLTDFGLARAIDDASTTQSGTVAGTPQYMAPEQARGEPVDPRSDLFSLGAVLYAMCTGHSPFRADGTMAVLKRVCEDRHRPVGEVNPDIPEWLGAIIDRLLAKNPVDRFQTAAEVAELLGAFLAHLQQPAQVLRPEVPGLRTAPTPRRRRRPRRRLAIAAAVLGLIGLGLGGTEAAGITQVSDLVATVLRIATPDGTLVVEVEDPEVQVRIDGEELVITSAGVQEIRLRPGQHRIQATRDGTPVHSELVTITRGGKQTVRVSLEAFETEVAERTTALPDLSGEWLMSLPAGFDHLVVLKWSSDQDRYRLEPKRYHVSRQYEIRNGRAVPLQYGFQEDSPTPGADMVRPADGERPGRLNSSGDYEFRGGRLVMVKPDDPQMLGYEWEIKTPDLLILVGQPDLSETGSKYLGAILIRVETPELSPAKITEARGPDSEPVLSRWLFSCTSCHETDPLRLPLRALSTHCPRIREVFTGSPFAGPARNDLVPVPRLTLNTFNTEVWALAYSPDGKRLVSGGSLDSQGDNSKILTVWDAAGFPAEARGSFYAEARDFFSHAADPQGTRTLPGHSSGVTSIAFAPNGRTFATGSWDHDILLWDADTAEIRHRLTGHRDGVRSVTFSPDGKTLVSASWDGVVKLWDVAEGREMRSIVEQGDPVNEVRFSPDGKRLATASGDWRKEIPGEVVLLDADSGDRVATLWKHPREVKTLAFSPDGRYLAAGGAAARVPESLKLPGVVTVWDVASEVEAARFPCPTGAISVAFSPDGQTLAVGEWSGELWLWDVVSGRQRGRIPAHPSMIFDVAFAPDGQTLATASKDGTIKLWDLGNLPTGTTSRPDR